MTEQDIALRAAADRHGFSEEAVAVLWEALGRGCGRMAQFSHPDLGGLGQWSGGGMVQIGDMFNDGLKARVAAACADLAEALNRGEPRTAAAGASQRQSEDARSVGAVPRAGLGGDWWPDGLGHPSASGSQNGLRYAYFADRRRLAIARDGHVTLYDTGHHRILGVSQRQSRGADLAFTAESGTVDLDGLAVVSA